jgi:hypothetical protein
VIVALWFAALLGIGSMVLPLSMFENFAAASGLADAFEAAQPPLGATARIGLALVAAALGALAGILVARRVAAAHAQDSATRRPATLRPSPKRPISAHDELDEEGIVGVAAEPAEPREPFAGRRRALAVTEESARSEFLSFAPLPGQSLNAQEEPLDLMAFEQPVAALSEDAALSEEPTTPEASATEPLAMTTDFAFGTSVLSNGAPHSRPVVHFSEARSPAPERATFPHAPESESEAEAEPEPQPNRAAPVAERVLGELGVVELVERFAIALQRHRDRAAETTAAAPVALDVPPEFIRAPEAATEAERDEVPQHPPLPAALRPFGFDESLDDEADEPVPDFDFAAALSPIREPFTAAQAGRATGEEPVGADPAATFAEFEEEFEETAEAEYTSLLSMKNPLGHVREPVRIDDLDEHDDAGGEPVVVFPGEAARRAVPASDRPAWGATPGLAAADSPRPFDAPLARIEQAAAVGRGSFGPPSARMPADPGETERALRDALEKLQKMSGAA